MTIADVSSPKLRLLHVAWVVGAAFKYCWKDLRQLVIATWFACALASLTRLLLEWLLFPWPPKLPGWMLFDHFDPPTWLMAFALTPWLAMGWAFVLDEMQHDKGRRGAITVAGRERTWLRFELSRPVLVAAACLTVVNIIDALTRFAQDEILSAYDAALAPTDLALTIASAAVTVIRLAVMVSVFVWGYVLAGMALRDGTFSIARLRAILRGNWLRVAFIFLLLAVILRAIYLLIEPASGWLIARLTDTRDWTLSAALIRFVLDFPFQMLWIVSWAVAIGIVLYTLDRRPMTGA